MPVEEVMVKGNQQGVIIQLDSKAGFSALKEQLKSRVKNLDHALMGAEVTINIGNKLLTRNEIDEMREILEARGLNLVQVVSKEHTIEVPPLTSDEAEPLTRLTTGRTLFITRHLRSGQQVSFAGNVVVLGDVNPGAEIIATGHILIMGTLRGLAHAGCKGDERAIVTALKLSPTQLRIANHITHAPENQTPVDVLQPEVALFKDNRVVIEKL
ncbi:MAG: septum site-determining protein MinC [Methylocystaceae bacterium]